MSGSTRVRVRDGALLVVAIGLVGLNLRGTITAVGPLLDQIGDATGLSSAGLGLLSSLPLVCWAVVSPLTHGISIRLGMDRTVLWALVVLAAGTALRSLAGPAVGLWLGTALTGVGLAIASVLMPAVIKRDFPERVPAVTATYTTLMGAFGALTAGVVVPISHLSAGGSELGWSGALLATGVFIPVAIVCWIAAGRRRPREPIALRGVASHGRTAVWRDGVAWLVAAYTGLQAASFYILMTWISPISMALGNSEEVAGFQNMLFQIIGMASPLVLPLLLRGRRARYTPAILPLIALVPSVGLLVAPQALPVWLFLWGPGFGTMFGTAIALVSLRARDPLTATALSGMAQAVGYLLAGLGPVVFGWLHGLTGGWTAPLILLVLDLVAAAAVGWFVGRDRHVLDRVSRRERATAARG